MASLESGDYKLAILQKRCSMARRDSHAITHVGSDYSGLGLEFTRQSIDSLVRGEVGYETPPQDGGQITEKEHRGGRALR